MGKRIGQINILDINIFLLVISILAFKDYPYFGYITSIVSFLFVLLPVIKENKIKRNVLPFLLFKILFILFCLFSVIWALNKSVVLPIIVRMIHRFIICMTIILYTDSKEKLYKIIKFMVIASIVLCLRMIIEVPFSAWGTERVGKYLAHDLENSYGNTGVTYVLGIVGIYLLTTKEIFKNKKIKYMLITMFSLFSLLSGSRKQVLFLVIAIPLVYLLKCKNYKEIFKNLTIAVIIVSLIVIAILKIDILYNAIGVRMLQLLSYFFSGISVNVDPSTLSRINFLKDSWQVFLDNPILGVGIGGYQYVNSTEFVWAENTFLELLADVGIIGLILYFIIHFNIIKSLFRRFKNRGNLDIQMIVVIVCLLVIDFTMVSYYHVVLQFYLALLYAQNLIVEKERNILYEKK